MNRLLVRWVSSGLTKGCGIDLRAATWDYGFLTEPVTRATARLKLKLKGRPHHAGRLLAFRFPGSRLKAT